MVRKLKLTVSSFTVVVHDAVVKMRKNTNSELYERVKQFNRRLADQRPFVSMRFNLVKAKMLPSLYVEFCVITMNKFQKDF